jgi:LmbE family N-acetylglucosaminyl deacetylase
MKTLLAMGSHHDDCPFGIAGIMLQAVSKHYRVVFLSLVGDYSDWPPIGARYREVVPFSIETAKSYGVEMRFMNLKSHLFEPTTENKRAVCQVVAEVQPDIAFVLWPRDNHDDHAAASQICTYALRNAGQVLVKPGIKVPSRIYFYDNGPRHTIGFEPDTFVDITAEWPRAIEWLGKLMAHVRNEPYKPGALDASQQTKEALARYRGQSCGVRYAEAVRGMSPYPRDIL